MVRRRLGVRTMLVAAMIASVVTPVRTAPAQAATVPPQFQEQIVFTGLTQPTNLEFAPDGRVFVAEKGGLIKVFDSIADTTPTVFADLRVNVHNMWDRGLLGLALAPGFPTNPWVYVLYTYDAPPGQTAPVWNDACANANGGTCVVTGRLSRLQAAGNQMTGTEQVLIRDWCQQYASHSIGDILFGADGMLYVSGGDGASFNHVDYGNSPSGGPPNPCADPPGGAMTPPTAEGGALRSQDVRSTADPTGLDGTILRLDPATGAAAPGNPLIGSTDLNTRRVVAAGLRNPFRLAKRPDSFEVWAGDVGWSGREEINRVVNPTASVTNFGWPCFEGPNRHSGYDGANLSLCESLYNSGGQTAPYHSYAHNQSQQGCAPAGSSIAGLAFYPSTGLYPAQYHGALFFADYSRDCIWAMRPTTPGGLPSTSAIEAFVTGAANPVDLAVGPGTELYYVDIGGSGDSGSIRRIRYFPGNRPPTAALQANPTAGGAPLTVSFSATGSTDPDPADAGLLSYAWDFTNDGTVDSTSATPSFTYTGNGTYTAKLTVTDTLDATDTKTVTISVGNTAPTAVMDTPLAGTHWRVGQTISFSGRASDPQQGTLPASALRWHLRMQHCVSVDNCHTHFVQDWTGIASGSFIAPDHEYPSYLELELVATDADGLSHNVVRRLDPQTVALTMATNPPGLQLTAGATTGTTPFTYTAIQGAAVSISAPTPQTSGGTTYTFGSWSDGGAQTHVVTAPTSPASYTATFTGSGSTCTDSFGYTCTEGPRTFVPGSTDIGLNGDDISKQIALPFPVRFYGQTYSTAWADTNGVLSFAPLPTAPSAWNQSPIPSAPEPHKANLALYPFWSDLDIDGSGRVLSAVLGSAPNRRFVLEWRNVTFYADPSARLSFEVIIDEDGTITYAYSGIDASALEQGSEATVGIENATGTVGIQVTHDQPRMRSGQGVTFAPPSTTSPAAKGTVTGVVTNGGTPAPGVSVGVAGQTATTDEDGRYLVVNVAPGSYTVTANTSGRCATLAGSKPVTVTAGDTHTVNVPLTGSPTADSYGYTCTDGARAFIPGDTELGLRGDDVSREVTLPFPVRFYGQSYSTAWVDSNGMLSLAPLPSGPSAWEQTTIPSAASPHKANLALYPYWSDLDVDDQARVLTRVSGAAPNRQFVVEWRNVTFYADRSRRVTFEIIFQENGTITFAYQGVDDNQLERGNAATIGIENGNGTVALQYSYNQPVIRSGEGVTFLPPAS